MGFFSGLLGGGSKQTVKTSNKTTVDIQIANQINVESLAKVLESIKLIFAKSEGEQTELQKLTLTTIAAGAQAEQQQKLILEGIGKSFKILVIGILGFLFWFVRKKRKGKRKK